MYLGRSVMMATRFRAVDSQGVTMVQFGYKLMTETTDPRALVRNARLAENAGFDFVSISDHFSSVARVTWAFAVRLECPGAIAETTQTIGISTGLTCPIMRYHPAIVAQAAATIGVMSEGRFTLAVGAGERLNEHVVGQGWPAVHQRHSMLHEAVEIIRLLWRGEICSYEGEFFHVDSARIYDLPPDPIPVVIGISGEKSAQLAAEIGDGIMAVEPKQDLVKQWKDAGGKGVRYGELALGYAATKKAGLALIHEYSRFGALGWSVLSELPGVSAFEDATRFVKPEDLRAEVLHGPDVQTLRRSGQKVCRRRL